ncbi:DnaT-like ssDNA-binding protein [Mesoterricola sediminis]|uniref:Putative DnaT-like domain-containing protein n=1 Tax=Mesoterricola sediminis TaxID=2927980 RepID=A0AA48KFC0_9BACT|nr:DnaT-like ssDNA-binding protein [Mesoterricola sediminis]BDU76298.1 hypothetical protein METESE_12560 [Mesoterricola sediminis]
MTLITTPGDPTANSLASLAEAEAYMGSVIFKDDWTAATEATKEAALRQASRLMGQWAWKGIRVTKAQAMCWPRVDGVPRYNLDNPPSILLCDEDGYYVAADEIPTCVKEACIEYAFRLLSEDREADAGALVPDDLKSGTTTITNLRRRPIPPSALDKVRFWLTTDGISVKLVRG